MSKIKNTRHPILKMNKFPIEGTAPHVTTTREQMIDLLCRVFSQKINPETLNAFSEGDWDDLVETARQQGVFVLLYGNLKTLRDKLVVPERVMQRLHEGVLTSAARNMLMLREAGVILRDLQGKNLEVIALKGLYLVENVYQDISKRSFSDLDLLVKKDSIDVAIACMQELGYKLETYYDSRDANVDIKHAPPMKKPGGPYVEIHWTILEENEPFTIDVEGLWARAVPASVAGLGVLALGVEDLLLHLCVHLGYQHHLNIGLRGLFDIAEVLRHFQGQVDWKRVISTARQWGAERVVWLVLKLTEQLLGTEIPQDVYPRLVMEAIPQDVLGEAKAQLLAGEGQAIQMTPDLAKLATTRGIGSKLKVMLSRVFIPRRVLARLYNMSPKSLRIVGCYFKRFADLMRQYGPSLKHVLHKDQDVMAGVADEESAERLKGWMGMKWR